MAEENADQISDWNGPVGQQWATLQHSLDVMIRPFGEAALNVAAVKSGQRIIDIGCGCGDTSIVLAQGVGKSGSVLGVDVSEPMLTVARARATAEQLGHLTFVNADASNCELPINSDKLFSRFGVMFFSRPNSAFRQMRKALHAEGRCVFVCWRSPRDNPWAMIPLLTARKALNITPAPADPLAPGPFAFADDVRLRNILADAGFANIDVQRFDADVVLGPSPKVAAESSTRIGPVARLLREVGSAHLPAVVNAIETSFASSAMPDGQVVMSGSTWIVSADNSR